MPNADIATEDAPESGTANQHGLMELPEVSIESYNLEIREGRRFVGDKASGRAFRALLDKVQAQAGDLAEESDIGDEKLAEMKKKEWDRLLTNGDANAAAIIHSAVEEFSQNLAAVVRRYLRHKSWRGVKKVAVGGGLRRSRVGELSIARTEVILKGEDIDIGLVPLLHHPDEGGLIGALHLLLPWLDEAYDSALTVDIGGSNIRAGILRLNRHKAADLSRSEVIASELWRYRDVEPKRDEALDHLGGMLRELAEHAEEKRLALAPHIGVGCPGRIEADGSIAQGAQNLPGNWEAASFNLPAAIHERIPYIGGSRSSVVLHNDAVMQGLSEIPRMRDVKRWAVLTIGTGLGNAVFANADGGKRKAM